MITPINRRLALTTGGALLALPFLESIDAAPAKLSSKDPAPKRMLIMMNNMGFCEETFWPKETGRHKDLSAPLKPLLPIKDKISVLGGLSHPGTIGGHITEESFCNGAKHQNSNHFKQTISIDQVAAKHIGTQTRFSSFSLSNFEQSSLSYNQNGIKVPAITNPVDLYKKLFTQGSQKDIHNQMQRLSLRQSVLDTLRQDYKSLTRQVSKLDQHRLDQYFTSIRQVEKDLDHYKDWLHKPKPNIDIEQPETTNDFFAWLGHMARLIRLAYQTDSGRLCTMFFRLYDYKSWHKYAHHGQDPKNIQQLIQLEQGLMKIYKDIVLDFHETQEGNGTMLDNTMILMGSNLGDPNVHSNKNLPLVLSGGSFKHGQYLDFGKRFNQPIASLYLNMMREMNLPIKTFADISKPLEGLS